MIYTFTCLYEININNCKIKEISVLNKGHYVDFIVKIKNNIYIYQNENLYLYKYLKDELIIISCYKYDKINAIKHLLNTVNPRIVFNIIISKNIIDFKLLCAAFKKLSEKKFMLKYEMNKKEKELQYKFERQFLLFEQKKEINFGHKKRIPNMKKNIKKINYLKNKKNCNNFKKKYR